MGGRPLVPGEKPWNNILEPNAVHARTIRALINGMDAPNGWMSLDFEGTPSVGRYATMPFLWFSYPEAAKAAWGRFMPATGDMVKVSFDFNDTPHIVGYDLSGGLADVADGRAGWPALKKARDANSAILAHFKELKSGEFDFMSSGGAYIFGSDSGQLLHAAGLVKVSLVKSTNTLEVDAKYERHKADDSLMRFGQVRRPSTDDKLDTADGNWNSDGSARELSLDLQTSTGGVISKISRFAIGNVATDTDVDNAELTSNPRRLVFESWATDGSTRKLLIESDVDGVLQMVAPDATKVEMHWPKGKWTCELDAALITTANDYELDVKGKYDSTIDKDHTITVKGNQSLTVNGNRSATIQGNLDNTISGNKTDTVTGNYSVTATGTCALTSTGSFSITSSSTLSVTATGAVTMSAPSFVFSGSTVQLGAVPTGGVFNGDIYNAAMGPALSAVIAAITASIAALTPLPIVPGAAVAAALTPFLALFGVETGAIVGATSKTVTVQL